jgi:hypothetical protein
LDSIICVRRIDSQACFLRAVPASCEGAIVVLAWRFQVELQLAMATAPNEAIRLPVEHRHWVTQLLRA